MDIQTENKLQFSGLHMFDLVGRILATFVCVCVWSAVGNGSVPVGPVMRLVHPIRAPFASPTRRVAGFWRGQVPNHHWLRLTMVGIGLTCVLTYVSLLI